MTTNNIFDYPTPGGRNPDAWSRRDANGNVLVDPHTAYKSRLKAGRIYAPAAASLSAQQALFGPTLALAQRGATEYGNLYRHESDVARAHQLQQIQEEDPMGFNLLNTLTGSAQGLAGRSDDPYADHELQQQLRAAQQARGGGYGSRDVLNEVLGLDRARDARVMARGQYGAGILGLRQNYLSAPAATPEAANIMSPIEPTGTQDLFSVSLNDTMQRRNQAAAASAGRNALLGAGISAVGGVAGAALKAIPFCWVAEELYGRTDIRTQLARAWVAAHDSPFIRAYKVHGRRWARWLRMNAWAKPIVQPIWDAMWKGALTS